MQGSVWALDADDSCLGVRGIVAGQGLMVRVGGLLVRVALGRRVGAGVAGDGLFAAWPTGGVGGSVVTRKYVSLRQVIAG